MERKSDEATSKRALAASAANLIATIGEASLFDGQLTAFLRSHIAFDSLIALRYHYQYAPEVLFEELDPRDAEALYGRYFEGAYLLSPFYLRWLAAREAYGLYQLKEIAPDGFFDSVYYTDYYGRSGLIDEVGFVVPIDGLSAVLVSLGRTARLDVYSDDELRRLYDIEPIVRSSIQRHHSLISRPTDTQLRKRLTDALNLFGSSLLTQREQNVVQLMLRGHSSKSCARMLGISPTTERVHRRNIYAKLEISSQAELFSLFFDALAADDLPPDTDPLADRRQPRHQSG